MVVILTTFFIYSLTSIFLIKLPSEKEAIIIYSNQTRSCLKNVFLKAIHKAQKDLIIHTFALTDIQTINRLTSLAKKGIALQILSDYRNLPIQYPLLKKELNWSGIKTSGLMHQKVLLVDDSISLLGTANMTYESMKMHDNLVIGFYSHALNTYLKEYTYKIPLRRNKKNHESKTFCLNNQILELWMLPSKGSKPVERLIHLIQSAHKSIDISIFTLTHPKILHALKAANHRGVKIELYIDKTSAQGASSKAIESLKDTGINIKLSQGIQLLHHKMMLIDKSIFLLGSANWTKSAFEKNHDFYLILSPLSKTQVRQIQSVFKAIKKESQ